MNYYRSDFHRAPHSAAERSPMLTRFLTADWIPSKHAVLIVSSFEDISGLRSPSRKSSTMLLHFGPGLLNVASSPLLYRSSSFMWRKLSSTKKTYGFSADGC